MTEIYRQGDVLIQRVACIPASTAPVARVDGRIILAEGEMTGHHHAIADDAAALLVEVGGAEDADRFLRIDAEVSLTHEEHDAIDLPRGDYRVRRQREYEPAAPPHDVAD
jgi:hypothetical protein